MSAAAHQGAAPGGAMAGEVRVFAQYDRDFEEEKSRETGMEVGEQRKTWGTVHPGTFPTNR